MTGLDYHDPSRPTSGVPPIAADGYHLWRDWRWWQESAASIGTVWSHVEVRRFTPLENIVL